MRAREDELQFCEWLLRLGSGTLQKKRDEPFSGAINLPPCCVIDDDVDIVDAMYNGLQGTDFASTVILTPINDDSLSTSEKVLDRLPGDPVTYLSADDVECDNEHERLQYPIEFLNNQTPSGLPPHKLRLKIGAVVMLLRNLDLNRGLCNGTRLTIRRAP